MQIFYPKELENLKSYIDKECHQYLYSPVTPYILNQIEESVQKQIVQNCLDYDCFIYADGYDIYIEVYRKTSQEKNQPSPEEKCSCSDCKCNNDMNYVNIQNETDTNAEVTWTYSDSSGNPINSQEKKTEIEILAEVIDLLDQLVCHEDVMRVLETARKWFKE